MSNTGKVIFADQLRGVAVIMVILAHWCGVYWFSKDVVANYIHAPVEPLEPAAWLSYLAPPTVVYGPFGVSIFFLISGFVIPFSLKRSSRLGFLVARVLRIYPVYIVGSLAMLAGVWLSAKYWGADYQLDGFHIGTNLLLVNNDFLQPTIDLINWTLAVEIKFYIACAVLIAFIRRGSVNALLVTSALIFAFCAWLPATHEAIPLWENRQYSLSNLKWQLILIVYMFIGTLFFYLFSKLITLKSFLANVTVLGILFVAGISNTAFAGPVTLYNFGYGLIVFALAYGFRHKARNNWVLDGLAKLSFPIYATHSILGYIGIRILIDQGLPAELALLVTLGAIIALATLLHVTVEKPFVKIGKWASQKLTKPTSAPQAAAQSRPLAQTVPPEERDTITPGPAHP